MAGKLVANVKVLSTSGRTVSDPLKKRKRPVDKRAASQREALGRNLK